MRREPKAHHLELCTSVGVRFEIAGVCTRLNYLCIIAGFFRPALPERGNRPDSHTGHGHVVDGPRVGVHIKHPHVITPLLPNSKYTLPNQEERSAGSHPFICTDIYIHASGVLVAKNVYTNKINENKRAEVAYV